MAIKESELIHSAQEHAEAAFNALQAERAEISRIKSEINEINTTPADSYGDLHSKAIDSYIEGGAFNGVPDIDEITQTRTRRLAELQRELNFRTRAEAVIAAREADLRFLAAAHAWQNGEREKVKNKVIEWAELLVKLGTLGDEIRYACEAHCQRFQLIGHADSELVPELAHGNTLSPKNFFGTTVRCLRDIHLATGWKPRKQDVGDEMFAFITSPAR